MKLSRLFVSLLATLAMVIPIVVVTSAVPAYAQSWEVESQSTPANIDCDHLYYSNIRSGAQFVNDSDGNATIENTVTTKRKGSQPPDNWSTNMAVGPDPDTGTTAAFYSNYTSGARKLYKHVSGTDTVTDEIYNGQTRELPSGVNWGGLTMDPNSGMLYGAQNGGAPKLFQLDLKTGASQVWTRGSNLTSVPPNDPVFRGGSMVPDMFVDSAGGAYYGISYGGLTYVYRLDPATGTTTQAVKITGPGSSNGFNNYGMAYHKGYIYFGQYSGRLYRADARTGVSEEVGGTAHNNQTGRIKTESGGGWPITDLASCGISPDLTKKIILSKSASKTSARPGDTVTYTITAQNTGGATATGVEVTDDLSGVVDDATYNNDAKAQTDGANTSTQPSYTAPKLTWTGDIAAGKTVTITYTVKVNDPPGGDKKLKNAVVSPDSNCEKDSGDPDCSDEVPIAHLKIKKTSTPAKPKPGDKVTYTITVENDGTADWNGASITDDLSDIVDDAKYNMDGQGRRGNGTTSGATRYNSTDKKLTWTGDVVAGDTVTITYSVTIDSPPKGNKRLPNAVVGPDGSNCEEGSNDPDCSDEKLIEGIVVKKTSSASSAKPGDSITYTITAQNIGASKASGVEVTDDLSGVVDDATYNNDAKAQTDGADTSTQPSYTAPKLKWKGDIPVGKTVTITYTVKVDSPPGGDKRLANAVVSDDSNCPDGSTDPDCGTDTPVSALIVKKTSTPANAKPGDTVTYTVTVENNGEAEHKDASFTDDLSGVLDDATFNDDENADTGTVSFDSPNVKWTGDLAVGQKATVTYSVKVDTPPGGDRKLSNAVVSEGSNCEADSTDPDCGTDTDVAQLVLKKTAEPKTAKPGDKITYTVTASNPGTATYRNATFSDDLTDVLDDAKYNDDASAIGGTAAYAEPKLTWTGDVAAGETVTITYSVTVNNSDDGDGNLKNAVTGPDDSNCPDGSTDPDCGEVVPIAHLHVSKIALDKSPKPGDTVRYNIMIVNDGTTTYRDAKLVDDLSDVLDDATYNDDAEANGGKVSFKAPKLTWIGDVTVDEAITITYTVKVTSPPTGDKRLKNAVFADGSNCEDDSDPDCGTDTPVPSLKIKKTATPQDPQTGDKVTYTVTVENDGEAAYPGASFTDDLSNVLDDATWNDDATADVGSTSYDSPKLTWTGNLAKGQTATIVYTVTVTNKGDKSLRNVVSGDGSNCEEGSTDPDCHTIVPTPSLEIEKTSDKPKKVKPGDTITYTITMTNRGKGTARDASFSDDLTEVLDDAKYNDDAKADIGTVLYLEPGLTWRGDLAAGKSVSLTYSVTVSKPDNGDKALRNVVYSPNDTNCPILMTGYNGKPREVMPIDPKCHRDHEVVPPGPGPDPDPDPDPKPDPDPDPKLDPDSLPITGYATGTVALLAIMLVLMGLVVRKLGRR